MWKLRISSYFTLVGIALIFTACRGRHPLPTMGSVTPYPFTASISALTPTTFQNDKTLTETISAHPTHPLMPSRATPTANILDTPSPNKLPTATLIYHVFSPTESSIFRFRFKYPSRWSIVYSTDLKTIDWWDSIILNDRSVPGSRLVLLVLHPNDNQVTEEMDGVLLGAEQNGKLLEDKIIRIDGYDARWVLREMPPEYYPDQCLGTCTPNKETIELFISMIVGEDGYWFELTAPVENKDSQLIKDFQEMILGMKYIP